LVGRPARKSSFRLGVAVAAALVLIVPLVQAEEVEVSREEYVQRVDAICRKQKTSNERLQREAEKLIRHGDAQAASKPTLRLARSFARAVAQIVKVPRPAADQARLKKWLGYQKVERSLLFQIGRALKKGQTRLVSRLQTRAAHVERLANRLVFSFEFKYCTKQT